MTDIATGWRRLATRMAAGVAGLVVAVLSGLDVVLA